MSKNEIIDQIVGDIHKAMMLLKEVSPETAERLDNAKRWIHAQKKAGAEIIADHEAASKAFIEANL